MSRTWAVRLARLTAVCWCPAFCAAADPEPQARPTVYCVLGRAGNGYALAFSPDGKYLLASWEYDGPGDKNDQIMEWDVEAAAVRRRFDPGHGGQVRSISYSRSGRFLAIGHLDGYVSVRDDKGDVVLSFMSVEDVSEQLLGLSVTETDSRASVHTVLGRCIVQTRSIPDGRTKIYYIHSTDGYGVTSAAMSRDGATLVCCCPLFLKVFERGDFSGGRELKSFQVFRKPTVTHVAVADDATTAMTVIYEGEIALFDLKKDKIIKRWGGRDDPGVYTILPFHGRNWFATGNDAGEIRIWDEKGALRATLKTWGDDNPVAALALTRDNRFLASSGEGRPIVIWDLRAILDKKD